MSKKTKVDPRDQGVECEPSGALAEQIVEGVLQGFSLLDLNVGQQLACATRLFHVLAHYVLIEGSKIERVEENRAAMLGLLDELRARVAAIDPKQTMAQVAERTHHELTARQKPGRA